MRLVTRREAEVTPEERELIAVWGEDAYGDQTWVAAYTWAGSDRHLFLLDGGEPVSYLKIVIRDGSVDGAPVRIGGIGSVMTPSALRGRGYASELMRRAAGFLFDELGVELGMLFCLGHLVPYYGGLGWTEVRSGVWIDQPRGRIRWPESAMVLPRPGAAWRDAEIDVRGVPW